MPARVPQLDALMQPVSSQAKTVGEASGRLRAGQRQPNGLTSGRTGAVAKNGLNAVHFSVA